MMDKERLKEEFYRLRAKYDRLDTSRLISRSEIRGAIWEKTLGQCWYCGKSMNPFTEFSIDHVIPRSRGGDDDFENLVPCCRSCNHTKFQKTLDEFRQHLAEKSTVPDFTPEQIQFLAEQGIEIEFDSHWKRIGFHAGSLFWGERNGVKLK